MDLDLTGKQAMVCGSTAGIGRAAAMELAGLGATVTLVARSEEKLLETMNSLPATAGQSHKYLVADFNNPAALKTTVSSFLSSLDNPIHILVNNTGGPPGGPIQEAPWEEFETALRQHLQCNHILVQCLLPGMQSAGYGRIINIISTSVKSPLKGLGVSNTTRGAVANWAKTLSYEVAGKGITVNNVLPGATATQRLTSIIQRKAARTGESEEAVEKEMLKEIPANRFAQPEETAAAIAFLASPAAGYINGVSLPVDGGRLMTY